MDRSVDYKSRIKPGEEIDARSGNTSRVGWVVVADFLQSDVPRRITASAVAEAGKGRPCEVSDVVLTLPHPLHSR